MQANGSLQVSLQSDALLPSGTGELCPFPAGVAQLVEHLFCKQAVGGSSPFASSKVSIDVLSEGCPSGQREQAVNLPAYAYAGSNPALSTVAGVAQLVERQPSKLNVEGSNPFSRSVPHSRVRAAVNAHLAQMVEHVLGKDEVTSSILVVGSKH